MMMKMRNSRAQQTRTCTSRLLAHKSPMTRSTDVVTTNITRGVTLAKSEEYSVRSVFATSSKSINILKERVVRGGFGRSRGSSLSKRHSSGCNGCHPHATSATCPEDSRTRSNVLPRRRTRGTCTGNPTLAWRNYDIAGMGRSTHAAYRARARSTTAVWLLACFEAGRTSVGRPSRLIRSRRSSKPCDNCCAAPPLVCR
jgi:hypothetical protein